MGKSIVILVLLLIFIGFIMALGLGDSDLLNPIDAAIRYENHQTEQAQLARTPSQAELDAQAAQDKIMLESSRALEQQKLATKDKKDQLELDRIEAQQRFVETASYMLLAVFGFGSLCGLTVLTTKAIVKISENSGSGRPPSIQPPSDGGSQTRSAGPRPPYGSRMSYQDFPTAAHRSSHQPARQRETPTLHKTNPYE